MDDLTGGNEAVFRRTNGAPAMCVRVRGDGVPGCELILRRRRISRWAKSAAHLRDMDAEGCRRAWM